MTRRVFACTTGLAVVCLFGLFSHTAVPRPRSAAQDLPVVKVAKPIQREVTDYANFTGRTHAKETVNIIPQVSGIVTKVAFKEGTTVNAGEVLFELDPRLYEAELNLAKGQTALDEARLQLAGKNYERAQELLKKGGIGKAEVDQAHAARVEADRQLQVSKAKLDIAKLKLEWTRVTSPISGQVGKAFLTMGNVAKENQTVLTSIYSPDPMYVYFDMDERTWLVIKKAVSDGKMKPLNGGGLTVQIGLAGDAGFPHKGKIDFIDNQIDPKTGTLSVRAVIPNPKQAGGERLLFPGMFARARLPISQPYKALLVANNLIRIGPKNENLVRIVNAQNKVQDRIVTLGPLQEDGLRVVRKGLEPDDWVVVGVSPGFDGSKQVQKKEVPMPVQEPGK